MTGTEDNDYGVFADLAYNDCTHLYAQVLYVPRLNYLERKVHGHTSIMQSKFILDTRVPLTTKTLRLLAEQALAPLRVRHLLHLLAAGGGSVGSRLHRRSTADFRRRLSETSQHGTHGLLAVPMHCQGCAGGR